MAYNVLHIVALQVGADQAERREGARDRRADDLGDAELAGERGGMQRPRPAEGGEHEIARIVAALHRHDLEHFRHRVIDHVDDGGRSGAHIDAERLGEPRCARRLRPLP